MEKIIENNKVRIAGRVITPFTFSHEVFGEGFYRFTVSVARRSEETDELPVLVSERLTEVTRDRTGEYISVRGQYRSYNQHDGEKSRLILAVFAREVDWIPNGEDADCENVIELRGFLCKKPIYRETPVGRKIADILLAINRPYGKSDYIPSICWGRNARFADMFLDVGDEVEVFGRIQSRIYHKQIAENEYEKEARIAYEVSIYKMDKIDKEREEIS